MKKVTGLGGIFFKCKDPKQMNEWYKQNLGIQASDWGTSFDWRYDDDPDRKGATAWATFREDTKHFDPSTKDFMINYRVENIEALVDELKAAGVTVVDEIAASEFGKFVHILDPEGNAIELWEAVEE